MKNRFKNVKVGQKVWSLTRGKGTVMAVDGKYVDVRFGRDMKMDKHPPHEEAVYKMEATYHINGTRSRRDKFPDLFLKKPVITTKARLTTLKRLATRDGHWEFHSQHEPKIVSSLWALGDSISSQTEHKACEPVESNLQKLQMEVDASRLSIGERFELNDLFSLAEKVVLSDTDMDYFTKLLRKGGVNV